MTSPHTTVRSRGGRGATLGVPAMIVGVVVMMVLPLPKPLLDLLLAVNLTVSLVILLTALTAAVSRYGSALDGGAELVWVQEEPANQGAWPTLAHDFADLFGSRRVRRVSRAASASPAAGSAKAHQAEQAALVEQALAR